MDQIIDEAFAISTLLGDRILVTRNCRMYQALLNAQADQ